MDKFLFSHSRVKPLASHSISPCNISPMLSLTLTPNSLAKIPAVTCYLLSWINKEEICSHRNFWLGGLFSIPGEAGTRDQSRAGGEGGFWEQWQVDMDLQSVPPWRWNSRIYGGLSHTQPRHSLTNLQERQGGRIDPCGIRGLWLRLRATSSFAVWSMQSKQETYGDCGGSSCIACVQCLD